MGNIDIPIKKRKQIIGILRLEDVLIVPTLDRRSFSVNSFLSREKTELFSKMITLNWELREV